MMVLHSGLGLILAQPPALESLNEDFLRNYHKYPDFLYRCYMETEPYQSLPAANFRFAETRVRRSDESRYRDGRSVAVVIDFSCNTCGSVVASRNRIFEKARPTC